MEPPITQPNVFRVKVANINPSQHKQVVCPAYRACFLQRRGWQLARNVPKTCTKLQQMESNVMSVLLVKLPPTAVQVATDVVPGDLNTPLHSIYVTIAPRILSLKTRRMLNAKIAPVDGRHWKVVDVAKCARWANSTRVGSVRRALPGGNVLRKTQISQSAKNANPGKRLEARMEVPRVKNVV